MTANAFAEDVVKAKKAGMNDHIAKPLDRKKMRAVLAKYIRCEMTPTLGGEEQISSSGGSQFPI